MPEMSSKRSSSRVRGTWHKYPQRALNRPLRQCRVLGTRPDARDVWSRVEIASGAGGAINEVRKRRVSALPGAFWGKGWGTLTSRRSENRNPPRRAVSISLSFFLSFSHPLLSAPFVSLSLSLFHAYSPPSRFSSLTLSSTSSRMRSFVPTYPTTSSSSFSSLPPSLAYMYVKRGALSSCFRLTYPNVPPLPLFPRLRSPTVLLFFSFVTTRYSPLFQRLSSRHSFDILPASDSSLSFYFCYFALCLFILQCYFSSTVRNWLLVNRVWRCAIDVSSTKLLQVEKF